MPNIETDVLDYKAAGKRDFFAEHLWILIQDSRALVLPPVPFWSCWVPFIYHPLLRQKTTYDFRKVQQGVTQISWWEKTCVFFIALDNALQWTCREL